MPTPELTQETITLAREEAQRLLDTPAMPTAELAIVLHRLMSRCKEAGINVVGVLPPSELKILEERQADTYAGIAAQQQALRDKLDNKPPN